MATKVINTILNLRDNLSGGLIKAARNTKGISKEMVSATRSVVAFKNKSVSAISQVMKKTVKWAAVTTGVVAGLAAKTGFSEAMDLEGYRTQLETATKDTARAGKVMQYAIKMANATPFEGGELVSAASSLEMFGLKTERWLPVLGDAAAGVNRSMDDVQQGFIKAATTGDFESLRDTLSVTKDMVNDFSKQKFGKGFLDNKGTITNMTLMQNALEGLLNERFGGGMERLSKTTKGLWSTVTGVTKNSLAKLVGMTDDGTIKAGSALALLKGKVSLLAEKLQQWQQDGTIDALADKFSNGLGKAVDTASQAFQWAREHGDSLLGGLKLLAGVILTLKFMKLSMDTVKVTKDFFLFSKTVGTLSKKVIVNSANWIHNTVEMGINKTGLVAQTIATKAAAAGTATLTGAQKLLNLAFVETPIGWIVLGITALIAGGVLLYKNWDKIKATAGSLWESVKTTFGGIRDSIVGAFETAKEKVAGFFSWIDEKISGIPVIGTIYKGIKSAGSWVANRIGGHAAGTSYFSGGLTRVNERGGEIMRLPGGTQIIPHDVSRRMVGGPSIAVSVTVQGNVIGNEAYAEQLGNIVAQRILRALRNS